VAVATKDMAELLFFFDVLQKQKQPDTVCKVPEGSIALRWIQTLMYIRAQC
jgi:hypothetical protein